MHSVHSCESVYWRQKMKTYTLEEARLMHSIGIRMRCLGRGIPSFIDPKTTLMVTHNTMECTEFNGTYYGDIKIHPSHCMWEIANDI